MKYIFLHLAIFISAGVTADGGKSNDLKTQLPSCSFTENKGQMVDMAGKPVPFVFFKMESRGLNVFITDKGLTYTFFKIEDENEKAEEREKGSLSSLEEKFEVEWNRVDVLLSNASIKKENISTEGRSDYFRQYFLANVPKGLIAYDYEKITIKEVYPGIDWVLYRNENGIKYDFVVHQKGDPSVIELVYRSAKPVTINQNGDLEIKSQIGQIIEQAPQSFLGGAEVSSKYKETFQKKVLLGGEQGYETAVHFSFNEVQLANRTNDLIIDPQLSWSTFFGGSSYDGPTSIANDNAGNVFVCGYLGSIDFPLQNNSTYFQSFYSGLNDGFFMKFGANGALLWSTYFGGNDNDTPWFIECDQAGNVFVVGGTLSQNFPLFNAGTFFQGINAGAYDAFILKFSNSGALLWSTYYGGFSSEQANGLAIDNTGNIFISGYTNSPNLPVQNAGTYFQTSGGTMDAFILKFTNGGSLIWATYYGGSGGEMGNGITVDNNNNIFMTGSTNSTNFPTQNAGTFFQSANAGGDDIFILKFDNFGNRLWATYYGGSWVDKGYGVDNDANGNLFLLAYATSTNFPVQNAGTFFQPNVSGFSDIALMKFDNAGNRLWATCFGGSAGENSSVYDNVKTDVCNNVFFTFQTQSLNAPTQSACGTCYLNTTYMGNTDDFLTKFSNNGTLLWGTYWGGNGNDFREAVSVDNNGNFYVTGEWTGNANYTTVDPGGGAYYSSTNTGWDEGYLAKFLPNNLPVSYTTAICYGSNTVISLSAQCLTTSSYSMNPGNVIQSNPNFTVNPSVTTVYTLFVTGNNNSNATVTQSALVTVSVNPSPLVSPSLVVGTCLNPVTPSVNLNVSFNPTGNPNYTLGWNPVPANMTAINSGTASGLVPGINTITITTSQGCTVTYSFNVPPPPSPASFVIINPANDYTVTCINPNIVLTTSITNGNPLSFTWFPSCTGSVVGTSMNFNQACTGFIVGTSSTGCQMTQTFTIYQDLSSPTIAISPTVSSINCTAGGACFTLTSNLGPNVTTNWFQISGTNTIYCGAAQGTINIFCAGQPGVYWGESVYNITGCKTTQSVLVTASVGVPVFTITSPTNFTIGCGSKSITSMQVTSVITSPVPNVPVNYTFMIPPVTGTPTTFTTNPNLNNIIIPGTYVVYTKDLTNNCVSSQSVSIIQNTFSPNINFIQPLPQLTCRDFSMVLTGISSNTNTQITWTVPAFPGSSVNPTPNATVVTIPSITGATSNIVAIGIWTVGVMDNNNFCTNSKTVQINQDIRSPKFTISALTNSVINCKNSDVVIVPIVSPSLAVALVPTYVWYPPIGNGLPGTQFNTTVGGTHTTISTSAVNGCTYSATYDVATDLSPPNIELLSFPFILDCNSNPTVVLTPSITGSTVGFTYTWTPPAGALTSNLHALNLTSNQIGNYALLITNTINGCSAQGFYQVTEGGIKADFIASTYNGFAPLAVTFTNTSSTSTGASSITSTWGFGNGEISQLVFNTILVSTTYTASGTYSVVLTVQKGTCIDQEIQVINVELASKLEIPNVFTPNGDRSNDIFRLRSSNLKEVYIIIFDRWGNKVYEVTSETGNFAWDGKNQAAKECADGTYFYIIKAKGHDGKEYDVKGNVSLFR